MENKFFGMKLVAIYQYYVFTSLKTVWFL